ncbi:hypothetical protein COU88_05470 [Candidatus Roizmanbacteria bacterium CG10_big_fil_rev_8_21_14_0_10_39_6]|uniref:Glycosyltransferase RgtA/B/C/D-like domain-containing protein n=1 Tax=Candidatus Roizmanbacteria bacterium CG10_big_fil_rev_8_21_14_0_10_39_6 TaxID=1974853 RepID=A0A2M8KR42_9BACT|nr:MAG: hypothetical protein COU88_05470 [Candidatus Roizmanbacteria bacterium CG10_big_fil_rev_8_21_14_0_10_39_6]
MYQYIWGADAGDLVTSSFLGLLPHPPAFPVYWLILRFAYLLPFGSIALRASFVSMFFGMASMFVSILTVYEFLKFIKKTSFIYKIVGFFSVVLVYSSFVFLLYSSVQEVYTLSIFLLALTTYYLFKFILYEKESDHTLFWLIFCVSVVHHTVLVLIFGVYIYFFFLKRREYLLFFKKHLSLLILFVAIAFTPYVLQYALVHESSSVYWEPKTIDGFMRTFLRLRYGAFNTGGDFGNYSQKFEHVYRYLEHLFINYTVFITLSLIGFYALYRKYKKVFYICGLGFIIFGPLLIFYANSGGQLAENMGVLERYYMFSYVFLPIIFIALFLQLEDVYARTKLITSKSIRLILFRGIILLFFVLYPLVIFTKNYATVRKVLSEPIFERHAQNILNSLPKKSVLILKGDLDLFTTQYVHFVRSARKDVIVLSARNMYNPDYHTLIAHDYPQLHYAPMLTTEPLQIVDNFVKQMKNNGFDVYTNVPFTTVNYSFRRVSYVLELYKSNEKTVRISQVPVSSVKKFSDLPPTVFLDYKPRVFFFYELRNQYAKGLLDIADKYYSLKKYKNANAVARIAYEFNPYDSEIVFLHTLTLKETGKCMQSAPILINYFEYSKSYKVAYALSRVYAICARDIIQYSYWDSVYKKLKPESE